MKNRNLVVGLFVAAGLTLFTVGLFLIGNRHQAFAHHIEFYAEFRDLSGLAKGAKVQVAGMDAGQVLNIGIPDSPSAKFRLTLRVDEKFRGLIRTDSLATIGTEGVVGGTFLLIRSGSASAPAAAPSATLPSKEPTELADLLDQGKGTLADVDATVRNANGLLTTVGGKVDSTLDQVKGTVSNVNDVVVGLKEGRGSVGMLLRDETLEKQVRQAVSNAQQASADLGHASSQADALVSDIRSRNFPQKIDGTLASVNSTASNIDASAQQLHQTITDFAGPDEQGVTAGVNIRESLSNANTATSDTVTHRTSQNHRFDDSSRVHVRGEPVQSITKLSYTISSAVISKGATMANLNNALQELRAERSRAQVHVEKLDQAISVIESLTGSGTSGNATQPKRIISAASRRKMALAQKARWAKVGKEIKPVVVAAKTSSSTAKRIMSASARRKIAAAQKARWAKVRAEQKKAA